MFDADLAYHARRQPRATALIAPGRRATYAELDADANRFASGLLALGVSPERGVTAVEATSSYLQHVLLVALTRLGVATAPADDAAADLKLSQKPGETDERTLRLTRQWIASVEAAPPLPPNTAKRPPDGLARVLLSPTASRTPLRTPLTRAGLAAEARAGVVGFAAGRQGTWVVAPGLDTAIGYRLATLAWSVGATLAADLAADEVPALLEREVPGLLAVTPIQLRELLATLPAGFRPIPGLRVLVTGGRLAPAVAAQARLRLTPDVQVLHGYPETGWVACGPAARLETTPGAAGWALPGVEIEVVDEQGARVRAGEAGELRIRGESLCAAYLGDPAATAAAFRDGAFHTGEVGRRLPDGSLVVEGRLDERMEIGGATVMPGPLEDAALSHPGVRDAAAFTVADARGQGACWLAVASAADLARESLVEHLGRCALRVVDLRFAWTDAIPRDALGRIDRNALRAQVLAALAAPTET